MTRTHCALSLLALGPLPFREFAVITGWPRKTSLKTISWLQETGRIEHRDGMWRLACGY